MGTTYTAWDGNDYEWPPPKGWYQAIDNRWWAPDTGPMAMGEGGAQVDATVQMQQGSEILNPAAVRQENVNEESLPAWARPNADLSSGGGSTSVKTKPARTSSSSSSGGSTLLLLMLGGLALVLIVLAFVIFGGGDDTPTTTTEPSAETTAPVTEETSESEDDPEATTPAPIEIIFNEETTANFEDFMTRNGFAIDSIDVRAEAQSRCTTMNQAQTIEEYNALIVESVENTAAAYQEAGVPLDQRLLSGDQERIINAIVVNFCPTVAERLGVTSN